MKLSQKKNCVNCWAAGHLICELKVAQGLSIDQTVLFPWPGEKCYKPKTKKQFKRAQKLMEGARTLAAVDEIYRLASDEDGFVGGVR